MMPKKNQTIEALLRLLKLDRRGWEAIDYWDADLNAIGIRRRGSLDKLVYVSTYNQKEGSYYCECELLKPGSPENYLTVLEKDNVSLDEMDEIIADFLSNVDSKLD